MNYDPAAIESKWQKRWLREKIYEPDFLHPRGKGKFYNLMMFPYPSAEGLHVGNVYAFTGADIFGRFQRMRGYDVFEPIGLDGFGIHSENYAIKIGKHPADQARTSEKNFYRQLGMIGNGFAWAERLETYDPEYYRWTQWIFTEMFRQGLAYRKKQAVNWCPSCKTVLADEQVISGECERCGTKVIKRELEQWFFKITKYAPRLLKNLETIDWSERIKIAQKNWIGRSESTEISFPIKGSDKKIAVVTTRADTIFGATFVVLAPEHHLVRDLAPRIKNYRGVQRYIEQAAKRTDFERGLLTKEKTGMKLQGITAVNPVNGAELPVYVSDFVLITYGTGAIMSVPAHDERDFEFAKRFHLPITSVIERPKRGVLGPIFTQVYDEDLSTVANDIRKLSVPREYATPTVRVYEIAHRDIERLVAVLLRARIGRPRDYEQIRRGDDFTLEIRPRALSFLTVHTGDGKHINSGFLNGLRNEAAIKRMNSWVHKEQVGRPMVNYRLRDWLISRQRYWGPPIPMIYCRTCGDAGRGERKDMPGWYAVPARDLPVKLPLVKNFRPTGTGKSPLATVEKFWRVRCPKCRSWARRETDVSDTFLDSAWYYLRYPSINDTKRPWDPAITRKWFPVDMYTGGAEHAVLHLLYVRFLAMAFYDWGLTRFEEPFKKFRAHGLIIKGGAKMSKSRGNVVNPDEYIRRYGADALRMYLLFLGPFEQGGDFRDTGIRGITRFLERVWRLVTAPKLKDQTSKVRDEGTRRSVHQATKKVTDDIAGLQYNTAISALMVLLNSFEARPKTVTREHLSVFLRLLAPFAPHVTEELWRTALGEKTSIHRSPWPEADERVLRERRLTVVIQVNGRVRDRVEVGSDATEDSVRALVLARPKILEWVGGKKIRKVIYVPGRVVNVVV